MASKEQPDWNFYESFFDSAPVALKHVTREGVIAKVNQAECLLLGYSKEEMLGRSLWQFIADEEEGVSRHRYRELMEGVEIPSPFLRRYKTKSGEYLMCEMYIHLVKDAAGKGAGLFVALSDITERMEAESVQLATLRWMESCFRSLSRPTMILDALGCIRYMNRACEELVGWTECEAAGELAEEFIPWFDIVSYNGNIPDYRTAVANGWHGAATISTKGGIPKRVEITTVPLIAEDGLVMGLTCSINRLAG